MRACVCVYARECARISGRFGDAAGRAPEKGHAIKTVQHQAMYMVGSRVRLTVTSSMNTEWSPPPVATLRNEMFVLAVAVNVNVYLNIVDSVYKEGLVAVVVAEV